VEVIDITGSGANILTLNALEVLNLSSHSNTLTVHRDIHDTVNIGTGWIQQADEIAGAFAFEVFTQGVATLKVRKTGPAGGLDGDGDFDVNDSFLIHLVKLPGTDTQIGQSKGNSSLNTAQIRAAIAALNTAGDVDGDGDFDANDSFLIHMVKLAGTDTQIDQSKGRSALTAARICANIYALGKEATTQTVATSAQILLSVLASVPQNEDASAVEAIPSTNMPSILNSSDRDLFASVNSGKEAVPTIATAITTPHAVSETVWEDFRHWIDAI